MPCCTTINSESREKIFLAYATNWGGWGGSLKESLPRYNFHLVVLPSSSCGLCNLQGRRWSFKSFCGQARKWYMALSFTFQSHDHHLTASTSRKYGFLMCPGRGNGIGEYLANLYHIYLVLFSNILILFYLIESTIYYSY